MATISDRDAWGIVLDLIKDRDVGDPSAYLPSEIDQLNPGAALAIARDIWDVRPPNTATPTPAELFANGFSRLKEFMRSNAETAAGPPAGKAAENAAKAAARARINADLGQ